MLQSAVSPKIMMVLGLALAFAAPAAAAAQSDLSGRIDRLESDVARARSELQVAQAYNLPPADIPGEGNFGSGQNAAALDVRLDRLENQMRTLNGQIEQMQFDIHRLDDALRKFQQDVDFRFQDSGRGGASGPPPRAGQRHGELDDQGAPAAAPATQTAASFGAPGPRTHGSDAFDPAAAPDAPGAPRVIGTLRTDTGAVDDSDEPTIIAAPAAVGPSSLPRGPIALDSRDPNAPLELPSAPHPAPSDTYAATAPYAGASTPSAQPQTPAAGALPPGATRSPPGAIIASLPTSTPRDDFDAAAAALKGEQFETAETGFKNFLGKYPKDRLVPDAVYYLGETYFQRSRYREAAEQYLKISTNYSKTGKAPDSLLRLGQSLDKLGAKEQACAAFAEVGRKYPSASANVRTTAASESKRDQCG